MKKFIFVEFASRGNSSFYSEQWLNALPGYVDAYLQKGAHVRGRENVKVYSYFGVFDKFALNEKIRKIISFLELYIVYSIIVWRYRNGKHIFVVNLHQSFHSLYWFCKKLSAKHDVRIVVHDAIEFAHNYPNFVMVERDKILQTATSLIVHNKWSEDVLKYLNKDLVRVNFPLPPLNLTVFEEKNISSEKKTILFIGAIREEKNVDYLIKFIQRHPEYEEYFDFVIAGENFCGLKFPPLKNLKIDARKLSEQEFKEYLSQADFVILPYKGGTNSSILAEATTDAVPAITSDIPMFEEHYLSLPELRFTLNNEDSLRVIFDKIRTLTPSKYKNILLKLLSQHNKQRRQFHDIVSHF